VNLYEELNKQNRPAILEGVTAAIGPITETREQVWSTVACHYVDHHSDPAVLSVYLVSAGRLIRYQHNLEDHTLTVCVPMSRLTRVSQTVNPAAVNVVVELDADRLTLSGISQVDPGEGDGPAQTFMTGNMFRSGWAIDATEQGARSRLLAFAARLRAQTALDTHR
jgi:hypothetical protein